MMLTYLDESGLRFGAASGAALRDAIDDLVCVMEAIRAHEDELLLWSDCAFGVEVEPGRSLTDFLYSPAPGEAALRDARQRLSTALDRTASWEGSQWELEVADYDVQIGAQSVFAPSLCQAIAADPGNGPVAALALATARDPGPLKVTAGAMTATLHVLTTLMDRPRFCRAWMLRHPPQPATIHTYTDRAFPVLVWTEEARAGLRANSKCFFNERFETTMRHLAVLNDHAADVFARESEPARRQADLGGYGIDASPESANTRADKEACRQRRCIWNGAKIYFWWHTKIRHDTGRIHFHHETSETGHGRIIVGLCVKHLKV